MGIKKTLMLSVFLHVSFFSAALLFSAGLIKGSRNVTDTGVLSVRLAEDVRESDREGVPSQREMPKAKKIPLARRGKNPEFTVRKEANVKKVATAFDKSTTLQGKGITAENAEPHENKIAREQARASEISARRSDGIDETDNPQYAYEHSSSLDNTDKGSAAMRVSYTPSHITGEGVVSGPAEGTLPPGIIEMIGNAIQRAKTYPLAARKRGIEGTVHVSFLIGHNGEPREIEVLRSSGYRILDMATVNVIKKAGPYPHINHRIEVPVAYRLRHEK